MTHQTPTQTRATSSTAQVAASSAGSVLPAGERAHETLGVADRGSSKPWWNLATGALLISPFAAHLLNRGAFWDGAIFVAAARQGDRGRIVQVFADNGVPLSGGILGLLAACGDLVLGAHLAVLVSTVVTTFCLVSTLRSLGESNRVAWFTGIAGALFSANRVAFDVANAPYTIYLALFMTGAASLVHAEQPPGRRRLPAVVLRTLGGVAVFLGVSMKSLIAWTPLVSLLLVAIWRRGAGADSPTACVRRVIVRMVPIGAALAHLAVVSLFFRPKALYAGYNEVAVSAGRLFWNSWHFLAYGVLGPTNEAFRAVASIPLIIVWTLGAVVWLCAGELRSDQREESWAGLDPRLWWTRLGAGFCFLAAGVIPYVVVGKSPLADDLWSTRHAVLVGIPWAFILAVVGERLAYLTANGRLAAMSGAALLIVGSWLTCWTNALEWHARWLRDEGVVQGLKSRLSDSDYDVYWVSDNAKAMAGTYRFYEWAYLFSRAYGDESRLGLERVDYSEARARELVEIRLWTDDRNKYRLLQDFKYRGREAELVVEPGAAFVGPSWELGFRGVVALLRGGGRWAELARNSVDVRVGAVEPVLLPTGGGKGTRTVR